MIHFEKSGKSEGASKIIESDPAENDKNNPSLLKLPQLKFPSACAKKFLLWTVRPHPNPQTVPSTVQSS